MALFSPNETTCLRGAVNLQQHAFPKAVLDIHYMANIGPVLLQIQLCATLKYVALNNPYMALISPIDNMPKGHSNLAVACLTYNFPFGYTLPGELWSSITHKQGFVPP